MPHQTVNGIQLYYETHGSPDNPALVLVHGLGSSTRDWKPQVAHFADNYHVITIDMRGHGQSDKPRKSYSVPQFAADTAGLLGALNLQQVHLVGISMGGVIALQMALDYPERLKTITVTNGMSNLVLRTLKEKAGIWMRFLIVRLMGMRKMGEVLAKRLFVDPDQESMRQTFIERWAENDRKAYLEVMQGMIGWDVEDRLGSIQTPTLVVASDQDYTPVAVKEAMVARMPNAQLHVIENAHHAVTMERPEKFNAVLEAFLAEREG